MRTMLLPIMLTAVFLLVGCAQSTDQPDTNLPNGTIDEPADGEQAPIAVSFEQGTLSYSVDVTTPTPCHALSVEERILESDPVQVVIDVTIEEPPQGQMCAQVLDEKTYEGRITTGSEPSRVTITTPQETYEVTLS